MGRMLNAGIYTLAEAARLAGLREARVRAWFLRRRQSGVTAFTSDYPPLEGARAISFHDLVDVRLAGELRRLGLSMQTVSRCYTNLQRLLDASHPFAHRALLTDGKTLFLNALEADGNEHVIDVDTLQQSFPTVVLPLLKPLDFDPLTGLATRWHIANGVVIDPKRHLGKPVVASAGIATHVLANAYEANGGNAEKVAAWYDVSVGDVIAAVDFEAAHV